MDVETELSIHTNFINELNNIDEHVKKYILGLIDGIKSKNRTVQQLKTYYIDEFDIVIKDVWNLGKEMTKIDKSVKNIMEPIKCIEPDLTFETWSHHFTLLDSVSSGLAFIVATNELLKPFSSRLFNLMSLYTHICTSLSNLSRLDKETFTQLAVLNDRINVFLKK